MLKGRLKQKAKSRAKQKVRSTGKAKIREAASKEDAPKVLKSAVGGGTAYQGGKKTQNSTQASASGTVGAGAGDDTVAQLQKLAQMHDSGVLTDEEFASAKQRLLAGG
jgi:hypothetical protein